MRTTHSPYFKANLALEALKEEITIQEITSANNIVNIGFKHIFNIIMKSVPTKALAIGSHLTFIWAVSSLCFLSGIRRLCLCHGCRDHIAKALDTAPTTR